MASLFTGGKFQALNALGIVPGALLYTVAAGGAWPGDALATYTDQGGGSSNANPVECDTLGQADVWLGSSAYRMILKTAAGVTIWDTDNVSSFASLADFSASSGSSKVGYLQAGTGAVATTLQAFGRREINVMDYGAVGDGVTDDTAAFNLATQSTLTWVAGLQYDIIVPSGRGLKFKLNGAVYVRKGQTLRGNGHGAYIDATGNTTTNTFVMGRGLISGSGADDAGGAPVKVENLFILGGAATKGVLYTNAQGFAINSTFLSAVGIGIEFGSGAADGLVSNVEIDQALTGIHMTGCQNIAVSNFNIYLANYAIQLNSDCRDITFNNGVIEYPQYAGVYTAVSASNVKAISFSNVMFTMNVQYGTFLGYVYTSASAVEIQYTGCSFRNWPGYAISHTTGVTQTHTFSSCVFDGNKTTTAYAQSTTAKVLQTVTAGGDGTYIFYNCEYRNILGEIAQLNDGLTKLALIGGRIVNSDGSATSQKRFNVVSTSVLSVTVKDVVGFPYVFTSGSNRCANLPWWGASTVYKVKIKGNTQNGGDSYYSAAEESVFAVTWQNATVTKSIYADRVNIWQTSNRTNPGQLTSVVCLGTAPGGSASTTTFAATGSICISVPFTAQANFDFFAETAV